MFLISLSSTCCSLIIVFSSSLSFIKSSKSKGRVSISTPVFFFGGLSGSSESVVSPPGKSFPSFFFAAPAAISDKEGLPFGRLFSSVEDAVFYPNQLFMMLLSLLFYLVWLLLLSTFVSQLIHLLMPLLLLLLHCSYFLL